MVYADIIAFKVAFPEEVLEENKEKTYSKRAKDLKEKLSMVQKNIYTKNSLVHVKSEFEVKFSLKGHDHDVLNYFRLAQNASILWFLVEAIYK